MRKIARRCEHNATMAADLNRTLKFGEAWLSVPDTVRRAAFTTIREALPIRKEWEKTPALKGKAAAILEKAVPVVECWEKSSTLRKYAPSVIQEAVLAMDTWSRQRQVRHASVQDLEDAHAAFKGKSPAEIAKGDALMKAAKQSSSLKSKTPRQMDAILALYSFWYNNRRIFKNAFPAQLVEYEEIARSWKKVFNTRNVNDLIQAESVVTAWRKNAVLHKRKPAELGQALELAGGWESVSALKNSKPAEVEAALKQIRELVDAKEASLYFDGSSLHWRQPGYARSWRAVSGTKEYWENNRFSVADQRKEEEGPLPEGVYHVRQDEFQIRDSSLFELGKQALAKARGRKKGGSWPGNEEAWGDQRVWVEPQQLKHPSTKGKRSNLAIHGGSEFGSNGCIDLADKMPEFADSFRLYGRDMQLVVEYPRQ